MRVACSGIFKACACCWHSRYAVQTAERKCITLSHVCPWRTDRRTDTVHVTVLIFGVDFHYFHSRYHTALQDLGAHERAKHEGASNSAYVGGTSFQPSWSACVQIWNALLWVWAVCYIHVKCGQLSMCITDRPYNRSGFQIRTSSELELGGKEVTCSFSPPLAARALLRIIKPDKCLSVTLILGAHLWIHEIETRERFMPYTPATTQFIPTKTFHITVSTVELWTHCTQWNKHSTTCPTEISASTTNDTSYYRRDCHHA